jgi:hypothetical protein
MLGLAGRVDHGHLCRTLDQHNVLRNWSAVSARAHLKLDPPTSDRVLVVDVAVRDMEKKIGAALITANKTEPAIFEILFYYTLPHNFLSSEIRHDACLV